MLIMKLLHREKNKSLCVNAIIKEREKNKEKKKTDIVEK
jgi:hypothetical protein